jgi:hypothetical protein
MIYLEAEHLEALKERARAERVSVAELIRQLVRQYLSAPSQTNGPTPEWSRLIGLAASGRADVSATHDRALRDALTREHLR